MNTREDVQQARKCLVTLNRIWLQKPSSLSEKQASHDLGRVLKEFILLTKNLGSLELEYILLAGKIIGFTSPMIFMAERSLHLNDPLLQVLRTSFPKSLPSKQDTWYQVMDLLTFDLMAKKAYPSMEQISKEEWAKVVQQSTDLVNEEGEKP